VRPEQLSAFMLAASVTAAGYCTADEPAAGQPASAVPSSGATTEASRMTVPWLLSRTDAVWGSSDGGSLRGGPQLHLDHDFALGSEHLTLKLYGAESRDHSTGVSVGLPVWRSELVLHMPASFFVGVGVEWSVALPMVGSISVGRSF
jgi:hypothetical protein